jgi:hypothetical protein
MDDLFLFQKLLHLSPSMLRLFGANKDLASLLLSIALVV